MVKIRKRASKRLAVAQREKVKRKVREHHRKSRKEARKNPNPQWRSKQKKDPGIPNSFPYKEQLLAEIEEKRRRQEEERLEERERRRLEKANANKVDEDEEEEDAMDVSALLQAEDGDDGESPMVAPLFRGTLDELLASEEIKTLIFAIDARDPQSYRSPWLEEEVTKHGKKFAFALGRADLVPAETLANWIAYLSKTTEFPIFPISVRPDLGKEGMLGAEALVEKLDLKGKGKGDVAVVGLGHSGRSSIADAVLTAIGSPGDDEDEESTEWPAVLDTMPLIPVKKHDAVDDLDDDEDAEDEEEEEEEDESSEVSDEVDEEALAQQAEIRAMHTLMRNQGAVQRIKEPLPLVWALMSRVSHPEDLMLMYNLPAFGSFTPAKASLADEELMTEQERASLASAQLRAKVHADTEEFLISLARAQGALRRGKFPSTATASRILLKNWANHLFAYYAQAPALSAEDKERYLATSKQLIAPLVEAQATVARKEFRKRWNGKELRLKPLSNVNGREALVLDEVRLMDPPYEESDEDDEDDEDEDLEDAEEDAEDVEDEMEESTQLKSILKKPSGAASKGKKRRAPSATVTIAGVESVATADDSDVAEEQAEDEEESKLSRKERRLQKKAKTVATPTPAPAAAIKSKKSAAVATATTKRAASGANAAAASTTTAGPAPGEKYDFGAFF